MNETVIWTSLEPCFGVISACLPTFRPLLRFRPKNLNWRTPYGQTKANPQRIHRASGGVDSNGKTGIQVRTTISTSQSAFDPERDIVLLDRTRF